MRIALDTFHGVQPRLHPSLLGDGLAVRAHNLRLKNGKLVPLRQPAMVADAAVHMEAGLTDVKDARSMHVWRTRAGAAEFLLFPGVTWAAPGNLADDEKTRLIVSGDTGVTFTDAVGAAHGNTPAVWLRDPGTGKRAAPVPLAKDPLPAPKVTRVSDAGLSANRSTASFFWTWVDAHGYESPASPASRVPDGAGGWREWYLEYDDGDEIRFEAMGAGNWPDGAVAVRVYKTAAGTSESTDGIQFLAEKTAAETAGGGAPGSGAFTVTVDDAALGEAMPEIEAPPCDLRCIQAVPGGFYAGFSPSNPQTVCFSDVGLVYSWPLAYRYDVGDRVVALAVTANTVFALTDGWPYVLSGTAPESMSVAKLAGPAACVSPRGVCVYRNAAYFASNAGLMTIYSSADAGTVCQNLTDKIFTKDQWAAFNPASCMMAQFDGALHLFFRKADGRALEEGLVIDLAESADAVTTHDEAARCLCTDDATDDLYFIREEV